MARSEAPSLDPVVAATLRCVVFSLAILTVLLIATLSTDMLKGCPKEGKVNGEGLFQDVAWTMTFMTAALLLFINILASVTMGTGDDIKLCGLNCLSIVISFLYCIAKDIVGDFSTEEQCIVFLLKAVGYSLSFTTIFGVWSLQSGWC